MDSVPRIYIRVRREAKQLRCDVLLRTVISGPTKCCGKNFELELSCRGPLSKADGDDVNPINCATSDPGQAGLTRHPQCRQDVKMPDALAHRGG